MLLWFMALLHQKRIISPFLTDGRGWPMPGIHLHFVGQNHQLFADAFHQGIEIATGQVVAANAVFEQHISRDEEAVFFTIK